MYSSHQALFVFASIFVFVFVWRIYPRPSLSLLSSAPPSSKSFSPCGWLDRRYDQKNTLFVANTDFFISTTFLNISLLAGVTSPLLQLSAEACGWISQEAVSSKQRTQCKMVAPWWHLGGTSARHLVTWKSGLRSPFLGNPSAFASPWKCVILLPSIVC